MPKALLSSAGSSPLARGLPMSRATSPTRLGIIPARAGFTAVCFHAAAASKDHPRSRGVYSGSTAITAAGVGSSPLARGLRG